MVIKQNQHLELEVEKQGVTFQADTGSDEQVSGCGDTQTSDWLSLGVSYTEVEYEGYYCM